jgi:Na+/H+ antiporter NhaD/arsenite permease-like protein
MSAAAAVFLLTYAAIAVGRVPGLRIDRTGIALVGAVAMLGLGVVPVESLGHAIHVPTILLLYGLMIVSAQFEVAGFYAWMAERITHRIRRPATFLWLLMLKSAALSALLVNDVVCLAFTPMLCLAARHARLNPVPYLLGLAAASNIGSAATILGNPQNMLIGQYGQLEFGPFLWFCGLPSLLALLLAWLWLLWLYRGRLQAAAAAAEVLAPVALDGWQCCKGVIALTLIVLLFFSKAPRELVALGAGAALLLSRRTSSQALLQRVDWRLITLFCGLFVVIDGIMQSGEPAAALARLREHGLDLGDDRALAGVAAVLSNVVSNVPATMLLVHFLDRADPQSWYVLALATTFAGNLITIGSIANLIVLEQGRRFGVLISFGEHARAGVPITLLSFAVLLALI